MAALCYSLAFAFILLRASEAVVRPECQSKDGDTVCAVPSPPQRALLLHDRLILGAIDSIYSFSPDLKVLDVGDASPSETRKNQCINVEIHQPALCRNFLRVVEKVNDSSLLVCGTNAVFPKCLFVQLDNLSAWEYMTKEGRKDVGYSPHTDDANVALLADNGAFFTATFFNFRQTQQTIGLSPSLLEGERRLTVQTPSFSPNWLNDPVVFVSAYDVGEHVYFFARELAYEVGGDVGVEYSRAIRICKNDTGFLRFSGDSTRTFRTFQKARLRCRLTGSEGTVPYDYDRLAATFLHRPSDGGHPILYASFSSAVNGPKGAALCKFDFAELESVMDSGEYVVLEGGEWRVETGGSFVCPGNEGGPQRTDTQAKTHQLVSRLVTATQPQPLMTVLGDQHHFLVADVVEYGGSQLEVVFAALWSGEISQLAWWQGSLYNKTLKILSSPVTSMVLHVDGQTLQRRILLTTSDSVQSLTLGVCSKHDTCFKCFDSIDPYCGWSSDTEECVNKLTSASSLIDSLTSTEESITGVCGQRPPTPPPLLPANPSSCPLAPDPPTTTSTASTSQGTTGSTSDDNSTVLTPAGLDKKSEEGGGESAGLIVGATVGGFLFGVPVGLVVCYLFFAVFLKKGSKSLEQSTASGPVHMNTNSQSEPQSGKQPLRNVLEQIVHRNPMSSKNVNQEDSSREEDDILTPLPFSKGNSHIQHSSLFPQQPPRYTHTPMGCSSSEKDGTLVSPV